MARIIVRNPTPGEVEAAGEVAFAAFGNFTREHWQKSFADVAEFFGERYILVVELDGRIVSTLLCCPAPIVIDEAEVTHSSVGAVATLPEFRKMGCAGALMTECVKVLRDEGIRTSSLWPFSYRYYRKFGWEVGAETRTYRANGSLFAQVGDASKSRAATPDDHDPITEIYDDYLTNNNCATVRSMDWWDKVARLPRDLKMVTEPGRGAVVWMSEDRPPGQLAGYAVYDIGENEDRRWVDVKEIVCGHAEGRRSMLALISSIDPEIEIAFTTPGDDLFLHEIPDPRAVRVSVEPSFQFRVIDPEGAMASLQPREGVECNFTLSVNDPVFKHGFEFGVEARGGEVSTGRPDRSRRLEMSVQTMAKLVSGCVNTFDAWQLGLVKSDNPAAVMYAVQVFASTPPFRSWLEPG